jgi:signal transduction histidine kinase
MQGEGVGSLERLKRIERAEQRLWFLALSLFLLLAVGLFLLDATAIIEERIPLAWTGRLLGASKAYALPAALLVVAWLICAYLYEKLMAVRNQNRDLVQTLDTTAQTLADRNQQLDTWSQLSHTLITNFNLPRLLELIARTAADVTESDCAALIRAEGGVRHLRLAAIYQRGLQVELAERVAAIVIRSGRAMCLSPQAPPEEFSRPDLPWDELSALAAEPLLAGERVVGALLVGRLKPHEPFSSHVLSTLQSFANQASIALEKAHLYGENQKQLDRLGKLLDDLHATQAQLTEAERVPGLGVIAGGVAYVVNNPAAAIMAKADQLLEQQEWDPDLVRREVGAVRSLAARVAETLTGLLALARRSGSESRDSADLNQVIQSTLDVMRPEYCASKIEVQECYTVLPCVQASPAQVQQAFLNLFVNALNNMPEGGRLSVQTTASEADWVQAEIADARAGEASDSCDKSCEAFGVPHRGTIETGLALAAAERIIRAQGGTMLVQGDSSLGTRVCVRLPIAVSKQGDAEPMPEAMHSRLDGELAAAGRRNSE